MSLKKDHAVVEAEAATLDDVFSSPEAFNSVEVVVAALDTAPATTLLLNAVLEVGFVDISEVLPVPDIDDPDANIRFALRI